MWVMLRVALMVALPILWQIQRLSYRLRPRYPVAWTCEGTPVGLSRVLEPRTREVRGAKLSVPMRTAVHLTLRPQGLMDNLGLKLGLMTEQQTGDLNFDEAVFLESDDSRVGAWLGRDEALRGRILRLFKERQVKSIRTDGIQLLVEMACDEDPDESVAQEVADLGRVMARLTRARAYRFDAFFWRVLLIESALALPAGYALGALAEASVLGALESGDLGILWADYYLATIPLYGLTYLLATTWAVLNFKVCRNLLGNSSRGKVVLIEALVVTLLAVPVASLRILADVNEMHRIVDPFVFRCRVVEVTVDRRETYEYPRRGDGRRRAPDWLRDLTGEKRKLVVRFTYRVELDNSAYVYGYRTPKHFRLKPPLNQVWPKGTVVQMTYQPGFLRLPYRTELTLDGHGERKWD